MSREIKFRAYSEHLVNNRFKYAYDKAKEKYDKIEPSEFSDEWDRWYLDKEGLIMSEF